MRKKNSQNSMYDFAYILYLFAKEIAIILIVNINANKMLPISFIIAPLADSRLACSSANKFFAHIVSRCTHVRFQ